MRHRRAAQAQALGQFGLQQGVAGADPAVQDHPDDGPVGGVSHVLGGGVLQHEGALGNGWPGNPGGSPLAGRKPEGSRDGWMLLGEGSSVKMYTYKVPS